MNKLDRAIIYKKFRLVLIKHYGKAIEYTRTKALGDGDDYCDYRLKFDRNKL